MELLMEYMARGFVVMLSISMPCVLVAAGINRRENLSRIELAAHLGVPITNYGMAISLTQGVLDRVLVPFQKMM